MAQYPNDPGPDREKQRDFCPTVEYDVLTTPLFMHGMELQTSYAYQCAKQLADKSVDYTNQVADEMIKRISNTNGKIDEMAHNVESAIRDIRNHILGLEDGLRDTNAKVGAMETVLGARMTMYDRQYLIKRILGVS